jgi:uncharacterized protein DUF4232
MDSRFLVLAVAALAAAPLSARAAAPSLAPIAGGPHPLAVLRACPSSQLKAAIASDQGAMMHRELRITLTNTGAVGCAMFGYPAIRLLDELKHPQIVAESFSRTPRMFIVSPGGQAAFLLRVATGDGVTIYRTVPTLAIVPPGDVTPLLVRVALPVAPRVDVTAVLPASELK